MSIKNGDMPAMPTSPNSVDPEWSWAAARTGGLTKREDFTKAAMVALLSNPEMIDGLDDNQIEWIVSSSAKVADMQLEELERTK